MPSTLILLVGEQPIPNILPIRHYNPERVICLYSDRTKIVYQRLCNLEQRHRDVSGICVDAYDIPSIVAVLRAQLATLDGSDIRFNVTGGTKPMSFAALLVARELALPVLYIESEGSSSLVREYRWSTIGELMVQTSEVISAELALRDWFDLAFGTGNWEQLGPGTTDGAAFEAAIAAAIPRDRYEVMTSVAAHGQFEIDLAIRYGTQFAVVEAKCGNNGRKLDGLKQLAALSKPLGTYTQLLYAITVEPNESHTAVMQLSRVKVLALGELEDGRLSAHGHEILLNGLPR